MDQKEERELEARIKKEHGSTVDMENLSAGVINAIPNEKDQAGNYDALNADFAQGGIKGSHKVNINTQTDLELGGLADPGGLDPVMDREYMKKMKQKIEEKK